MIDLRYEKFRKNFFKERYEMKLNSFFFIPNKSSGNSGYEEYNKEILKHVKSNSKIIDIGCGLGSILYMNPILDKKRVKVTGIDASPVCIKFNKEKFKNYHNISFRTMDIFNLKFKDYTFDLSLNSFAPHAFHETWRVLKPGGIFILLTMSEYDKKEILKVFGFKKPTRKKYIVKNLKSAGFKILKIKSFVYNEYFDNSSSIENILNIIPFSPRKNITDTKIKKYVKLYSDKFGIRVTHRRLLFLCKKI